MKNIFRLSIICLLALATAGTMASCDKENTETGKNGKTNENVNSGENGENDSKLYVDLGLPSGTLWKIENEEGYYDNDSARKKFGDRLPTQPQISELLSNCTYTWDSIKKGGCFVSKINNKSIFMPALGCYEYGVADLETGGGFYWSSSSNFGYTAFFLLFFPNDAVLKNTDCRDRMSVRLVKAKQK